MIKSSKLSNISVKNICFYLMIFLVSTSYSIKGYAINLQYLLSFVIIFLSFIKLLHDKKGPKLDSFLDFFPLTFILVWIYGFVLGFLNHNATFAVISNFAGMSLFIFYFVFLILDLKPRDLIKIIIFGCLVNSIVATLTVVNIYFSEVTILAHFHNHT